MKINRFRMILFKLFSFILIFLSLGIIGRNFYTLSFSIFDLIKYKNNLDSTILYIGILRECLRLFCIIFGICLISKSIDVIKLKKDILKDDLFLKRTKHSFVFLSIIGIIIQLLSLSDLTTNIIMGICIATLLFVQVLITDNRLVRLFEFIFFIIYISIIIGSVCYSYLFCHFNELPSKKTGVSTSSNYISKWDQIWRMSSSKDLFYGSFYNKESSNNYNMSIIPGIKYGETLNIDSDKKETCTSMTPQGIALSDKYIFVSSYCHTHKHNSLIFVIDRESRKFIKQIVLDDITHAGGLAYDDTHNMLWVATKKSNKDSINEGGDEATVSSIKLEDIISYDFNKSNSPIRYYQSFKTAFKSTSFLTYNNGYLYTGYFQGEKEGLSLAGKFKINDDGEIINDFKSEFMFIAGRVQSMAFVHDKVIFTVSYGLEQSKMLVYNYDSDNVNYYDSEPIKTIITPQMLEQVYPYNNQLYLLFESSSFAYRYNAPISMDYIVSMNNEYFYK